jgi:hypothetical protein
MPFFETAERLFVKALRTYGLKNKYPTTWSDGP